MHTTTRSGRGAAGRHTTVVPRTVPTGTAAIWSGATLIPPLFHALGIHPLAGMLVHACYSPLCHQIPERTLFLFGAPMAVCARCAAIYMAFTAAVSLVVLRPHAAVFRRVSPAFLLLFLAPMLVDVAFDGAGIRSSTLASRLLTGAPAGFILGLFAADGWRRAFEEFHRGEYTTLTQGGST